MRRYVLGLFGQAQKANMKSLPLNWVTPRHWFEAMGFAGPSSAQYAASGSPSSTYGETQCHQYWSLFVLSLLASKDLVLVLSSMVVNLSQFVTARRLGTFFCT